MIYKENDLYWIWLTQVKNFGPVKQRALLELYGNAPEEVYRAVKECDKTILSCPGISEKLFAKLCEQTDLKEAENILAECMKKGIRIVSKENLPVNFRQYDDLPIMLYVKGTELDLQKEGVAIVGARRCSKDAKNSAIMIAMDAVSKGYPVISGMAKGIDSYSHTAALRNHEYDGITIAVLGNGVDICYPKEHEMLYRAIQKHGVVVSEYPPGTTPRSYRFPQRNRIIAAWAQQLYVIGAGQKSGTFSTMEAARRYGVPYEQWP